MRRGLIGASLSEPHIDGTSMRELYMVVRVRSVRRYVGHSRAALYIQCSILCKYISRTADRIVQCLRHLLTVHALLILLTHMNMIPYLFNYIKPLAQACPT